MSLLRVLGALLLVGCGWCAGGAAQAKLTAHEAALRSMVELLQRIRQEVAYRRQDLGCLYTQLQREGVLPPQTGGALQTLAAPAPLTRQEAACFTACMAGLGHVDAQQECERLDYYIARFAQFLAAAQTQAQARAALSRKLGLAAGAMLALLFV